MSFGSTFGAMLVALLVDAILYGIAMLLVLQYYYKSFNDHWSIKTMVGLLGLLATLHLICYCDMQYQLLITDFGNYPALDFVPLGAFIQVTSIYIIAFISQIFFTKRIVTLSRTTLLKLLFTVPIMLLSLTGLITGLADTVLVSKHPRFSYLSSPNIRHLKTGFCLVTAACDITITAALWFLLNRSRTGIRSTDNLLNTLIIHAINRGAVTSLAALLYLILFLALPKDLYFKIAMVPMSQHYVISVVSSLNSRTAIRNTMIRSRERADGISVPLETIAQSKTVEGGIHVSTSVVTWEGAQCDSDKVSNDKVCS